MDSVGKLNNMVSGHECVDLGLSVKWASCNVGAVKPTDCGDYFAWGETKPVPDYRAVHCHTWSTKMPSIGGNPEFDAATANWGDQWRLPTPAEIDELIDKCHWEWTNEDGINGYRITGTNGNSIFIPAAGYRLGTELKYVGEYCHCWSTTPVEWCNNGSYILYFGEGNIYRIWNFRYFGRSIRAVCKPQPVIKGICTCNKSEYLKL